jgi:hypothetical protein
MSGQEDFFDFLMMFRICFFPVVLKVNAFFFKPSLLALLSDNWIGLVPEVSIDDSSLHWFCYSTNEHRKNAIGDINLPL